MLIGVIAEELLSPLALTDRTAHVTDDLFLQARIFQVGFVAPGLVDETALLGVERTFDTYVTQDYQGIWPELFDDTVPEIFYSPTRSTGPVLVSALFKETDLIHAPRLDVVAIAPSIVHVDPDIFHAPAFSAGLAPNLVVDSDVIRRQIIRRDGDPFILLLETFDDTDAIYAPVSASGLSPGIVTEYYPDNDRIYAASRVSRLGPDIFSPGDTFFAPFIFNELNPSCVLDTDVFIGPELRTPGRMGLVESDDAFPVPSVQFEPLAPLLVVEADIIPSVLSGSVPPIVPFDPRVDFDDTFYESNVIVFQTLTPYFWPDVDTILPVTSVFSDADLHLLPDCFVGTDVFFVPGIAVAAPPFATWDPLNSSNATLSNGNLTATATTIGYARSTSIQSSGKFYWEVTITTWTNSNTGPYYGVASTVIPATGIAGLSKDGNLWVGFSPVFIGATAPGDTIGIAIDITAQLIWFRKAPSGNWNGSGTANPATGVGGLNITSLSGTLKPSVALSQINDAATVNFGAAAFSGAVPSGFTAGWPA